MRASKSKLKKLKGPSRAATSVAILATCLLLLWVGSRSLVEGQDVSTNADEEAVFTPAHSTFGEAVRHFLGWRPDPEQPIAFQHRLHLEDAGLECTYCHNGVSRGPVARIPGITLCMDCHLDVATDRPAIEMLTSFYDQGQEPPWQRVYGWLPEAHVRFNHVPHFRAEVECTTCHGNVSQMGVAERVVDHTMGFCVSCHEQNQASTDCMACHY